MQRPLKELLGDGNSGILWAINRYIFHPRGLALALHVDDDGNPTGWELLGDGSETWCYDDDTDDDGLRLFNRTLSRHFIESGSASVFVAHNQDVTAVVDGQ